MRGAKAGILEERAKVLAAASTMAAVERAREEKKAAAQKKKSAAKSKPAHSGGKSAPRPKAQGKKKK